MKMITLILAGVLVSTVALAQEMGFANPDGTQDSVNLQTGEIELQFRNSDGSYDRVELGGRGRTGLGLANPDGSQDTIWLGGSRTDSDDREYPR